MAHPNAYIDLSEPFAEPTVGFGPVAQRNACRPHDPSRQSEGRQRNRCAMGQRQKMLKCMHINRERRTYLPIAYPLTRVRISPPRVRVRERGSAIGQWVRYSGAEDRQDRPAGTVALLSRVSFLCPKFPGVVHA